jgi:hypothetical protein
MLSLLLVDRKIEVARAEVGAARGGERIIRKGNDGAGDNGGRDARCAHPIPPITHPKATQKVLIQTNRRDTLAAM